MGRFFVPLLFVATLFSFHCTAQKILWAYEVLEFSSERRLPHHMEQLNPQAYKAPQALGKPKIYPGAIGDINAWCPRKSDKIDFIKVRFKENLQIRQVGIVESLNPTAIHEIYFYDEKGKEHLINTFSPRPIDIKSRILNFFVEKTPYKVTSIKIVIDGSKVPGYNGIDAIAISDSDIPISIDLPLADDLARYTQAKRLSDSVNSPYKDLKPLLSPDGNTLFFSRVQDPANFGGKKDLEDIWFSEKDSLTGEWLKAKNMGSPLNNKSPNFISSVQLEGDTYIVLLGNRYKGKRSVAGASYATKTDEGFTAPQTIRIDDEQNYSKHVNFFLAQNGQVLLKSALRRGSYGGRDLYVSFKKENGHWTTPKNLGKVVNTPFEESSPFLAADNRTLYFASNGHLGFGGMDIYMTRRLDDSWTNWSEPENLGPAINTHDDEMFFYLGLHQDFGYFVRGDGTDADIYSLNLPVYFLPEPVVRVYGKVLQQNTNIPIPGAEIEVREMPGRNLFDKIVSSDDSARYDILLPWSKLYQLGSTAKNFLSLDPVPMDLTYVFENKEIELDLYMLPVKVGLKVTLNNIYFDFDRYTLRPESKPAIDRVNKFLNDNPNIKVELAGHTCSLGSEPYNQKLSENRANAVREYLIVNGGKSKRIESMGYGELKPLVSNATEEGREKNRRVEFVIKEM